MNHLAAVLACLLPLLGCGGDSAPAASPPPAAAPTTPTPPAPDPLEAPTGLRISAVGADFIEWNWNPVAEVSGYQVQYSTDDEFTDADEVIDRTADQTSYRRENLSGGMTAYLRVRAARGMGEGLIHSPWSLHVTGMTPAPPPAPDPLEAPTGLRISAVGADFIEWNWNPVAQVSGYQVQYSTDDEFTDADEVIDRTADQTSYRRENLSGGMTAYLRVRSLGGMRGEQIHSAWSMQVTGITVAPPPPPPATTWRGLTVVPEERCAPYDADDYRYPQSVENDIVRDLGGIYSPYTCESFDSIRETDIEHIVARSEAHDSGLCRADAETRRRFARDLLNLTLASPALNRREKVAHDAAEWLPDQNRCWFAQRVVDVRLEYGLTIDRAEADALDGILTTCRSTEISCDLTRPPPVAAHPPIQTYPNCNAMREAGWTRGVNRNGGTYQEAWDQAERQTYALNTARDRDNDGHACE